MRPHPDELLRRLEASEAEGRKGRLKIFLGYAPRVGKSEQMFDEGRRRCSRGQDVVVGAIQARGSEELEDAIRCFEVIPLREGAVDVDSILRRSPQVCLIDELARRNPPNAHRAHRWQDVEDLLAAGINVVTAVNLQHVFEQQEAVLRITGQQAQDSVPESFLRAANEIVVIDAPAGASAAQKELREMALLVAAQVVEDHLQRYMNDHGIRQSWGTQERILVCITPRSDARTMLESGAESAARFHGQMLALYVPQTELNREDAEAIERHLNLARGLGAEVHTVSGSDPIGAILEFAHEHRATQIFLVHPQRSAWEFWKQSPVERLIRDAHGIDVRLFPQRMRPL